MTKMMTVMFLFFAALTGCATTGAHRGGSDDDMAARFAELKVSAEGLQSDGSFVRCAKMQEGDDADLTAEGLKLQVIGDIASHHRRQVESTPDGVTSRTTAVMRGSRSQIARDRSGRSPWICVRGWSRVEASW